MAPGRPTPNGLIVEANRQAVPATYQWGSPPRNNDPGPGPDSQRIPAGFEADPVDMAVGLRPSAWITARGLCGSRLT